MRACLSCLSVFKPELISHLPKLPVTPDGKDGELVGIPCPTSSCSGQVIEIDELILPVIFILNYKGYQTKACCSGHVYHQISDTYIMFQVGVELPELPDGFRVDESDLEPRQDCVTIRKSHASGDRVGSILLTNKKLYDWARALPNQNEQFMGRWSEIDQRQNDLLIMRMLSMGFSPYKHNIPPLTRKKAK